jgi:hypothetical protein
VAEEIIEWQGIYSATCQVWDLIEIIRAKRKDFSDTHIWQMRSCHAWRATEPL